VKTIQRSLRHEHGGIASVLILIPLLLIFMEMIIFAGRVTGARADVNAAASEAARMASIAAGAETVDSAIEDIAGQTLENRGRQCSESDVWLSEDSTLRAGGVVAVEVVCTIDVSDLGFLARIAPIGNMSFDINGKGIETIDPLRVFEGSDNIVEVP